MRDGRGPGCRGGRHQLLLLLLLLLLEEVSLICGKEGEGEEGGKAKQLQSDGIGLGLKPTETSAYVTPIRSRSPMHHQDCHTYLP